MIHGHKKSSEKKKSEEEVKQENELSEKINTKLGEFFKIRNQPITENKIQTLMEFTMILMQLCPDITTIFNYRRELVEKLLETQDPISKAKTLGGDIKLITKIMQQDPKSYTLWSYRQWLVLKLFEIDQSIVTKQKQLCSLLLTKDEKNFHVWNYRNWVNTIKMDIDIELEFTRSKINSNPFNFSPYHFRSKYLAWKYEHQIGSLPVDKRQEIITYGMPKEVFDAEIQTVRTAIFLNPKQEAPWLYYNWLLKQLTPVLLLDIKPLTENIENTHTKHTIYGIILSQNVQNFKDSIYIEGNQQFQLFSHSSPSYKWQIRTKQPIQAKQVLINSTSAQAENKNHGCKKFIAPNQQITDAIKIIFEAEQQFVKEVLESEENKCRFAWLQLLQIYKLNLYLGTSEANWQQITRKGVDVFNHLEGETKGQKYLEKQKVYWERLHDGKNLSEIEAKLKTKK